MDYPIVKRLDTAFKNNGDTWDAITYANLHKTLKEEYGSKVAVLCGVLLQFGPSRLKKTSEMSVAKFAHLWLEQLPECMVPGDDDAANRRFVDLIKRSLFYYCLDDPYLQKELCDLKGVQTYKTYFDQAVIAEQKRKSFSEIGVSGAKLDFASGISISKWDTSSGKSGGGNSKVGKYSGGGSNFQL